MAWMEEVAPQPQPSLRRICGPGEALTSCLLRAAILDPAPTPHQQLMLMLMLWVLTCGAGCRRWTVTSQKPRRHKLVTEDGRCSGSRTGTWTPLEHCRGTREKGGGTERNSL